MSAGEEIEGGESGGEVLAEVRAAGFELSPSQLARRHRAGLIARPETRPLGRGKGSISVYPFGTGRRLVRTLELARGRESFENVAWRAWWQDGGDLDPLVRERLLRDAARWEAELSRLADVLAGEDAGDPDAVNEMDSAYLAVSSERMPASLGRLRRNVGRERFATVFRVFAEVAGGRFTAYPDEESEAAVEQALRFDRARVDRLKDGEPCFEGSSAEDFCRLSTTVGCSNLVQLAQAGAQELDVARRELRSFWQVFEAIGPLLRRVLGSEVFGFGTVGAVFAGQGEANQPFFVLIWLALREDPRLREGMAEITAALPEALAARDAFALIEVLRAEVPAFAEAMSDESLRAALLDEEHAEMLARDLARLYEGHRAETDRFSARHPELIVAPQPDRLAGPPDGATDVPDRAGR